MADAKISALPASTTPLAGTEVLPIVQSGTTKQVSVANLTAGRDVTINTLKVGRGGGSVATNTVVGFEAINATATGANNSAYGYQALRAVTTGSSNTAVGNQAGLLATTGTNAVFVGHNAGRSTYVGDNAVAIGALALYSITSSLECIAIGRNSLFANTSGSYNVGIGSSSLFSVVTATHNVGIGFQAGYTVTGNNNILIGSNSGNSGTNNLTTGANNILIGYQAQASAATVSNEITIGNSSSKVIRYPHSYSTVANLPLATIGQGSRTFVTDALAPIFQATVAGGGAVFTPVYSDGTNWIVG